MDEFKTADEQRDENKVEFPAEGEHAAPEATPEAPAPEATA